MQRFKRQAGLGLRWLRCGWRLFLRNPWLLGGMGFCCSAVAVALVQVPAIGSPFLGLLVPTAIASFYVAVDDVSKQKMKLPRALWIAALKQSLREFMNVARQERRLMQVVVLGFYSLVVVVLTDILAWLVAGPALASPLASLSAAALAGALVATLLRLAIYALLAASLVFTLPLAMLQNQALVPAMVDSLRRAWHYGVALIAIVALVAIPFCLYAAASLYSAGLGYVVSFLAGAVVLPISACGLYCSYRTVFTASQPTQRASADLKRANYV